MKHMRLTDRGTGRNSAEGGGGEPPKWDTLGRRYFFEEIYFKKVIFGGNVFHKGSFSRNFI